LLAILRITASDAAIDIRASGWPKQPHVLSRRINEATPNLRRLGLRVYHGWRGSEEIVNLVRLKETENSDDSEGSDGFGGDEST
jgi:hypothetical protein